MAAVPKHRITHKLEVYTRHDGKYDLRIIHANGNILMQSSQGYENRADAITTAAGIIDAVKDGTLVLEDTTKKENNDVQF